MSDHSPSMGPNAQLESDPDRRYRTLPPPIEVSDWVETYDTSTVPEPVMGVDPIRDFLLRHGG